MSKLIAIVKSIDMVENLNIVKFNFNDTVLTMMSLDLNNNIEVGTKVSLAIKPTHVAIGKGFNGIVSYSNQIKTTIIDIDNGKLLSVIKLGVDETIIESIITAQSSLKMDLNVGDSVIALIKASEISIERIIEC
ncbi:MAG: TOBE domain-containing protein [Campylobacterota bacterium]|nr:TOBE domain-containing protein [Campylobacterota bacterium]